MAQPEPAEWEILISHHLPASYGRTFVLRTRRRTLHVCARCAGQVLGVIALVLVYLGRGALPVPFFALSTQFLVAFAPIPAAVDWLTQTLGRRESTNPLRTVSGALLGFASADALALLLTERWLLVLGAVFVLAIYLASILAILWATGGWRKVLESHFPGLAVGAAPSESGGP
jgi:uncharacterized membrane protein